MSDIAVIYNTKQGSTAQYALWLTEALNADIYEERAINDIDILSKYSRLIFGMPIYNGKLYGGKILNNNYTVLKNKQISIFIVGMTELDHPSRKAVLSNSISHKITKISRVYDLRGNYNLKKLRMKDRINAALLSTRLQRNLHNGTNKHLEEMVNCLALTQYWLDKSNLEPLLYAVRNPKSVVKEQETDKGAFFTM